MMYLAALAAAGTMVAAALCHSLPIAMVAVVFATVALYLQEHREDR
jgi:hypothetical protein